MRNLNAAGLHQGLDARLVEKVFASHHRLHELPRPQELQAYCALLMRRHWPRCREASLPQRWFPDRLQRLAAAWSLWPLAHDPWRA